MGNTREDLPFSGRVCLVTGASGKGIGYESAKAFAEKGCKTILACRDMERCNESMSRMISNDESLQHLVSTAKVDLAEPHSVRSLGKHIRSKFRKIDILVNNAATATWGFHKAVLNRLGYETTLFTNSIGPAMVTLELLPLIKRAGRKGSSTHPVIITVASSTHRFGRPVCFSRVPFSFLKSMLFNVRVLNRLS